MEWYDPALKRIEVKQNEMGVAWDGMKPSGIGMRCDSTPREAMPRDAPEYHGLPCHGMRWDGMHWPMGVENGHDGGNGCGMWSLGGRVRVALRRHGGARC